MPSVTTFETFRVGDLDPLAAFTPEAAWPVAVAGVTYRGTAQTLLTWLRTQVDTVYAPITHSHVINDVTGLQTALNLKANLAGPTFTGVPAAPTAAPGTSTTQLATTAFVAALGALKANLASPTFTGVPAAPTATAGTSTTQLATTAFVTAADNLKANLASPGLTGTPTAPTATAGTNNTQLATTAFVTAAINALIGGSPGLLDTLDELAAALGDDPNFAATMATALALKAPLASPGLTGVPTAPTASPGTNNTQLATTAYADALGALKANLASPSFTGTPSGPTASPGTNTTQLATTAFVAALGALKANLAGPTFTGVPSAPTAAPGTNTTQLATTAFVAALGATKANSSHTHTVSEITDAANLVKKDEDAQLTKGVTATITDDGTKSAGTYTPTPAGGNFRRFLNNGAFTLAPPSAADEYTMVLHMTNGASAGLINTTGFTKRTGDPFTTTNGHAFQLFITKIYGSTTLNVIALQ